MTDAAAPPFLLPVSYWPARTATYWWEDFRQDEVVREFNLAFASGATLLHVAVPWDASQPYSENVSLTLMRNLETTLGVAADIGLRCVVAIAVASLFDVLTVPHWFYELSVDERARLIRVMRRLYEDPLVLAATNRLTEEMTGEFGDHPSLQGWIVGDGMFAASHPRSADHFEAWLDRLRSAVHARGKRVWHGVSSRDIGENSALRFRAMADAGIAALVRIDWRPSWVQEAVAWPVFLASYIRSLGGLPPLLAGTGSQPIPPSDSDEAQTLATIDEVRAAGAAGILWPALLDYDVRLRTRPPFTTAPAELTRGLLPTGGHMSARAAAWLGTAANAGVVAAPPVQRLDEELRTRDPMGFLLAAYRELGQ